MECSCIGTFSQEYQPSCIENVRVSRQSRVWYRVFVAREGIVRWIAYIVNFYQGEWEDDDRCGWGELMYNSGDKYKGEWLDDKQRMYCPAQLLFFYF